MFYLLPISSVSKGREKPGGGSEAVVGSLNWVLPVLIQGQVEISLSGAVGTGGSGQLGVSVNAGLLINLIWFEVGMHPQIGPSLRASVPSIFIKNNAQCAELQTSVKKYLHRLKFEIEHSMFFCS